MQIANDSPVQFFLNEATNNFKAKIDSYTDTIVLFRDNGTHPPKGILFEWDIDDVGGIVIGTPFFYDYRIRDLYFETETSRDYFDITVADSIEYPPIKVLSDIIDYYTVEKLEDYDPYDDLPYAECLDEYEVIDFAERILSIF